jgi:membrane protease YdiL (CAAX protease family)
VQGLCRPSEAATALRARCWRYSAPAAKRRIPMQTRPSFIKRHSVLSYYVLTFAVSWSAILWVIISRGIPGTKEGMQAVLPVAIVEMLLGPAGAGLLMIGLADGRAGFRDLGARLAKWRVGLGWYLIAALLIPLSLMAASLTLSLFSPVYLPGIFATAGGASRLMLGIFSGVAVGICEELGWTGLVTPKLRSRYSILGTGILMGVLWGAWHLASHVVLASGAYAAPLSQMTYIGARGMSFLVGQLLPIRVLIVWLHDRTGSLPLAMLMHWGYTASAIIFEPVAIAGVPLLINDVASALTMWAVVGMIALANRGQLAAGRQPQLRPA